VSEHAVEVAVNRLRVKLGPAAVALETTNRRGYRLAVA
jgi:DNA-binding response OmpR family regulator